MVRTPYNNLQRRRQRPALQAEEHLHQPRMTWNLACQSKQQSSSSPSATDKELIANADAVDEDNEAPGNAGGAKEQNVMTQPRTPQPNTTPGKEQKGPDQVRRETTNGLICDTYMHWHCQSTQFAHSKDNIKVTLK